MTDWSGAPRTRNNLRRRVLEELRRTGFDRTSGGIVSSESFTKDEIRALHARQRADLLAREHDFVNKWQDRVVEEFANGDEVDPTRISPRIVRVRTDEQAALFRYTTLHWSVPVSRGYGRRTRFLVMDRQNDRLIGIFALGDPVYNLTARDQLIGWSIEQRNARLYNVLDAFVLGAVPPYRQLLGGKLIAMVALSDTTREIVKRKYDGQMTKILGEVKQPRPVLITTTSALGRSSIYNRVKFRDDLLYHSVGYTRGFGHFQFSEQLFRALLEFLSNDGGVPGYSYGQGPNWRIRTLRVALKRLDLDPELIHHGIRREVFLAPLARKWKEYLCGEVERPSWYRLNLDEMADFFRTRWALPRSERDPSFRDVRRDDMALSKPRLRDSRGRRA
jgi:hypothetical protein